MKSQGREWLRKRLNKIRSLREYVIGETVESLARRLKMKPSEIVKLNRNENFFMPKGALTALLMEVIEECDSRIYPQEEETEVKEALGQYLGLSPQQIIIGAGSDQLIDLIARAFPRKDDEALSITPTFYMYRERASLQGMKYTEVPLKDDFSLDIEQILSKITPKMRLFFLCSPNNPTANQFRMNEMRSIVEGFQGLVAVDEAYGEFADYSVTRWVEEFENLVVLRTFSKAFGLAGLRLGYAVSNPDLAVTLSRKVQLPYSVSSISLRMGLKLLENIEVVKKAVEETERERNRLIMELNEVEGVTAFDSQTNFVLFRTKKPSNQIFQSLLRQGILVRNLSGLLPLQGCLRATVGLPEMNNRLLAALGRLVVE